MVDIEFAAQHLQIVHAAAGGPLDPHTSTALAALRQARLIPRGDGAALEGAWRLQQNLSQLVKVALPDTADPADEPDGFRRLLAAAGGAGDFAALTRAVRSARAQARKAFMSVLRAGGHTVAGKGD